MKKRVLVVDDEAVYAMMLRRALTEEGFEVKTAGRGADAISVGQAFAPDLLLCDWNLPDDVNGPAIVTELRKTIPHLKVVFISGLVDNAMKAQARAAGAVRVLEKPVSLEEMLDVARESLG